MSYIGNQPTTAAYLTDQFSGTGSLTTFLLSASPANPASIIVVVHGLTQDPTTYSISGNTLNFSGAPPAGTANISVRYLGIPASGIVTTAYRTLTEFTATAGQTTFTPPSYTVNYISVFRNGVRLGSADYTATNGTSVVLASGASAGDLVVTESFYVSSVLNAIPNTANAVNQLLISDGAISQSKLATNVAGTGPSFQIYKSAAAQSITSSTWTKITFDAEEWDTNNNFTSSRFTPTVAGYYQINGSADMLPSSGTATRASIRIYQNGSASRYGTELQISNITEAGVVVSALVYCNGTTDYVELYALMTGTSPTIQNYGTYFQASLVRAA